MSARTKGTLLTVAAFICALFSMTDNIWLQMTAFAGAVLIIVAVCIVIIDAPEETQ